MLSQKYRFHGRNSLNRAYRKGRTVRDPRISLRYVYLANYNNFRVAVVVSRKVSKSAVVRNRIRRRIYEAVRLRAEQLRPGYELIFSVYSDDLAKLSPKELEVLILSQLKQAGVVD